ncbi:zinc finger domain containing protein [Acanthamoeba castellanii str. Neff]|uniref:RING-type E3 ubiquitin transferase n=1 Tax=Acanthamoeba castellanii (strain ATCC 30010 / Neff) TaxID=1257118 RepID=L8H677_ACACF|nr:zinc finger domain containing protein [Acanthamoeba castellanii str. Neff]ELR20732.1 zinc finger domain containing protein [Acanthamoeba castellanii str. Neff]
MESETSASSTEKTSEGSGGSPASPAFECNICFDTAQDPVVTLCGHLFCWPCIYKWLELHPDQPSCPVCKAAITREKLVPLYGRGKEKVDPRTRPPTGEDIPERPRGQRGESVRQSSPGFHGYHDNPFGPYGMPHFGPHGPGNWHTNMGGINFGFGFFPFGMQFTGGSFGYQNNLGPQRPLTPQEQRDQQLSRFMFTLGIFILFVFLLM